MQTETYTRGMLRGPEPIPELGPEGAPNQDRVLVPRFFVEAKKRLKKGADPSQGDAAYEWYDVEMLEILIAGDSKSGPVHKVTDGHRRRFARQYEAFRRGVETIDYGGTPLKQWPVLTGKPSVIRTLEYHHVHSVESLAELPDTAMQGLGMGAMELREQARAYCELKKGSEPIEALTKQNRDLAGMVEMLKDQITEMQRSASVAAERAASAPAQNDAVLAMLQKMQDRMADMETRMAAPPPAAADEAEKPARGRKPRPPEVDPTVE